MGSKSKKKKRKEKKKKKKDEFLKTLKNLWNTIKSYFFFFFNCEKHTLDLRYDNILMYC